MKTNRIAEIMTTNVISIQPRDTMDKVDQIFQANAIHHIPVVEDAQVVGMISKSDYYQILHGFTLFKAPVSKTYNEAVLRSLLVREVMTKQVACLRPEDTLDKAADYFRENLFHAIPITNLDGQLMGILSTYDLITHCFSGTSVG
ncbi:MAG: CBS domain-containing protein [Saprospiraceae bacterium]